MPSSCWESKDREALALDNATACRWLSPCPRGTGTASIKQLFISGFNNCVGSHMNLSWHAVTLSLRL